MIFSFCSLQMSSFHVEQGNHLSRVIYDYFQQIVQPSHVSQVFSLGIDFYYDSATGHPCQLLISHQFSSLDSVHIFEVLVILHDVLRQVDCRTSCVATDNHHMFHKQGRVVSYDAWIFFVLLILLLLRSFGSLS